MAQVRAVGSVQEGMAPPAVAEAAGDGRVPDVRTMRHSAAHVMAEAVQELFPDVRLGIGPAIEDGFYYDFELPRPLTPDDLTEIEGRMRRLVQADVPFQRRELDRDAALALFRERGQHYKVELIEDLTSGGGAECAGRGLDSPDARGIQGGRVSLYRQGAFEDLCGGPHVGRTGEIGPFKLLRSAGAYWRGTRSARSCSASTAPPGHPRKNSMPTSGARRRPASAITDAWGRTWGCSSSATR